MCQDLLEGLSFLRIKQSPLDPSITHQLRFIAAGQMVKPYDNPRHMQLQTSADM